MAANNRKHGRLDLTACHEYGLSWWAFASTSECAGNSSVVPRTIHAIDELPAWRVDVFVVDLFVEQVQHVKIERVVAVDAHLRSQIDQLSRMPEAQTRRIGRVCDEVFAAIVPLQAQVEPAVEIGDAGVRSAGDEARNLRRGPDRVATRVIVPLRLIAGVIGVHAETGEKADAEPRQLLRVIDFPPLDGSESTIGRGRKSVADVLAAESVVAARADR